MKEPTQKFPLIYWANKITLQKSAGQLERLSSLLAKSTIDLNPHQIYAAIYALNSPLARGAILADEVGLGKTIEAGIIISQLWLEKKKRILIIVPASLRTQWRDELETHFGLPSTVLDTPYFESKINAGEPVPMTTDGIYIASLPFVYNRTKLVAKQPWDLVVVDEAHRLRNVYKGRDASKMAYALRNAIESKPKLLLTATPLQNNLMELYGLISFIDDKLLGSKYFFKSRFVDKLASSPTKRSSTLARLRRLIVGPEEENLYSPSGVVVRTLRKQVKSYLRFPPRKSITQDFTPTKKEEELYNKVSNYLQRPEVAAIEATQRNLMVLVYRKLLASSSFAIAPTLKKLKSRLENELKLREIENDAATVEGDLEEHDLFEEVEDIDEVEKLEKKLESKGRVSSYFSDQEIKNEIVELKSYYNLARSIKKNAKGEALIEALKNIFQSAREKGWPEKAVIFTESRRTQKYLSSLLSEIGISYTPFNGSNNSETARKAYDKWRKEFPELAMDMSRDVAIRQALIHNFKTNTKVLLTTEAGAEGLNLQFCNIVVNYDLPWNPQRVEQRIGRCHRYGQEYEVVVANMLNTKNHADKRVLELMQQKLKLFEGLFGASDEILGALGSGLDFETRIVAIYQTCQTPEEIDAAFESMQKEMEFQISGKIKNVRSKLIEHFDAPITQLFKKTKQELEQTLSDYDQGLLNLCKIYFGDDIQKTDDPGLFRITQKGKGKSYLFREEEKEEIGKIQRMHSDHQIIKNIVDEANKLTTKPIPTSLYKYAEGKKKVKELESYRNMEGYVYLFKLVVQGVEKDETLVPLAFIKQANSYKPLTHSTSQFLVELPSKHSEEKVEKSPIRKKKLLEVWNTWKKDALEKYTKKNQRLYVREENRINRYWDSQALRTKDKIEKIEEGIKDLKRRKQNTIDFDKNRKLAKKIQRLETKLHENKIKQVKEESEALRGRKEDLNKLNKQLQLDIRENLIAVTKFKLI